jgi:drug/metabolite transporter (DMT)-like permease
LYAFLKKADLSTVAILQTVLYAIITLGCAVIFFDEKISPAKALWAAVAILAVVGMNTSK